MENPDTGHTRRSFIENSLKVTVVSGIAGLGFFTGCKEEEKEEEISPPEDLMREHGVLNRVLLVYDHFLAMLASSQTIDPQLITDAAIVIRTFIEDYHEKQEEDFLFPRFERSGKLTGLVRVLRTQHQQGRIITDQLLHLGKQPQLSADTDRLKLNELLTAFVRMYRPHEAREDTVLFPALRDIISKNEFDSLGEDFEKREHRLFGEGGFELFVNKVTEIEKRLGIYDLAQFTPKTAG